MPRIAPYLSALTRFEHIGNLTPVANTPLQLASQGGNLPMDRFIERLRLTFSGRITVGAAAPAAINADFPWSLIDHVVVEGFHRVRRQKEQFINLRGPDLHELNLLYGSGLPLCTIDENATGIDLPYQEGGKSGAPEMRGVTPPFPMVAVDTYDLRFTVDIPFVPLKMPLWKQAEWLLDAPNYDQLQLTVFWADEANIVTVAVNPLTFTAFRSAIGTPTLAVSGRFAQAGASAFSGFVPGRVWRYFSANNSTDLTTTGTQRRLFNIPRGNRLRAVLLKTGVKAVTTAGNNAFLTVSDYIINNVLVMRGTNKLIRRYNDHLDLQSESVEAYGVHPDNGHALIDFCEHGVEDTIFDLRSLVAGPTGDVDTFIQADVTGVAAQEAVAVWEEWRGFPLNYASKR